MTPGGPRGPEGRRPADVYIPRLERGIPTALDFAVTSGLRADSVVASALDGAAAAARYEDTKNAHLDTRRHCEAEGFGFKPMVVEACGGGWAPSANTFLWKLAKTTALATGELPSVVDAQIRQGLALVPRRENARAILRRRPLGSDPVLATWSSATAGNPAEPF